MVKIRRCEFMLACLLLFAGVLFSAVCFGDIPIEIDVTNTHHVKIEYLGANGYSVETTGGDPFIISKTVTEKYDPDKQYILSFEYFCVTGLDQIQFFYGPPFTARQMAQGPELLSSEGFTNYSMNIKSGQEQNSWKAGYEKFRIDLGTRPDRKIQIRNIKLRAPNEYELKQAAKADEIEKNKAVFDAKMKETVRARYQNRIDRVIAKPDGILIEINADASAGDLYLCEVPFYQTPVARNEFVWKQKLTGKKKQSTIKLDRVRQTHDRFFSSWILMRKTGEDFVPASHQRFAESIAGKWELRRDRPISKKGMPGLHGGNQFQYDDYKELGIYNCTKNILLNHIFSPTPRDGFLPHTFNGMTIYCNPRVLQQYDKSVKEMDELNIVVSAIILIHGNTPMSHPDYDPAGSYAMPNVVEHKGWAIYAAALDFLAERYTRPDRKYGRITHWIMHNEVDSGWVWTNAGDLPMDTYLDLYYRSMRTAQNVIRRYGNAGDVLISLTHFWTAAHNSKCYAPKDMLDLLAKRSKQEGDFDWGLAYHPYPQNLFNPRTWEDRDATFDFNTKFITPKNIEVLNAYMHQERMLYNGKVRTIVLSEQGSNSRGHTEKSYSDQAAGLVYTWLKIEKLKSIESYIHHRWMDHLNEGGLNLGIWTNPKGQTQKLNKKPAWYVWKQMGTDEQFKSVEQYKEVIGEEHLENIPYNGEIKK